jgi:hypothetical protein
MSCFNWIGDMFNIVEREFCLLIQEMNMDRHCDIEVIWTLVPLYFNIMHSNSGIVVTRNSNWSLPLPSH